VLLTSIEMFEDMSVEFDFKVGAVVATTRHSRTNDLTMSKAL